MLKSCLLSVSGWTQQFWLSAYKKGCSGRFWKAPYAKSFIFTANDGVFLEEEVNLQETVKMAEAEVSLRLAFWLFDHARAESPIDVAIDGAQVRINDTIHFDLPEFLYSCGWQKVDGAAPWQCEWVQAGSSNRIRIHSDPGRGDVVARLSSGRTLRVECKKGPLVPTASSPEYPRMREALGQLLTVEEIGGGDILAVAVPHSPKFDDLAKRWRNAPLIKRLGLQILTVDQKGNVFGFQEEAVSAPPVESDILRDAIDTFRVYCGVVLLSFAKHGQDLRETVARNFVARGMSCTQSIFAAWQAGREQDAWILYRSLMDRLMHLHHLGDTNGFSDFDDFSFVSQYEARHQLLCDIDMRNQVPDTLKEIQKNNKARYELIKAKQLPRWRRPKAEDVAKKMDLGFLHRFGYDYASTHVHPMSNDGELDFTILTSPALRFTLPDATVVKNSILIQSMLVQQALNVSEMRWRAVVYDFLDQIREFLRTGDQHFEVTMYKIGISWPNFQLCERPAPTDGHN
jgi:hypothetical protein